MSKPTVAQVAPPSQAAYLVVIFDRTGQPVDCTRLCAEHGAQDARVSESLISNRYASYHAGGKTEVVKLGSGSRLTCDVCEEE